MPSDDARKAKNSKAENPDRPARETIKGLPEHAQYQKQGEVWYVYYPYCFSVNGKRKQERDYIGTLSPDGLEFRPNLYYVQNQPVFEKRPIDRWKNPVMRQRVLDQLNETKKTEPVEDESLDLDPPVDSDQQLSVGPTVLSSAILHKNGMVRHVANALNHDPKLTVTCLNLAIHAAITTDKTYLANQESSQQKFIGRGCPSSPRVSEFFQQIGSDRSLSKKMAKSCAAQMGEGEIVALDGTRIDCNSENIDLAAVGKRKDGTYGSQVNVALVVNVENGRLICYRPYAGNVSDISTLDDLRKMWTEVGIDQKAPLILMDRGYPSQQEFMRLNQDGYRFLIGAKASMNIVRNVIDQYNSEFYDQKTYLLKQRCYGVKSTKSIQADGKTMEVHSYVFRSPNKEMTETDELRARLDDFQTAWPKKRGTQLSKADEKLYNEFFKLTDKGELVVNDEAVSYACYGLGYFGLVGNVDISLLDALKKYRQRNEVEVTFKLMFQHLLRTTRVHSSAAFDGLLMTTFVGLSILTYLRSKMDGTIPNELARNPEGTSVIGKLWTIQELLKDLRRIKIAYSKDGTPRLLNVVKRDRDVAAALGFPGLFDSAEGVVELLSGTRLAERIAK